MDMNKSKLNTSEVSRWINKGRATVVRHARAGKTSYTLDDNDHMVFDASEVARVYADEIQSSGQTKPNSSQKEQQAIDSVVKEAQDKLIKQYESRIEHLERTLEKSLEITPLLENRSTETAAWQASLEATTQKIANQTEAQINTLKQTHDAELLKFKRALHRELNKTWWDKLFARKRAGTSNRK